MSIYHNVSSECHVSKILMRQNATFSCANRRIIRIEHSTVQCVLCRIGDNATVGFCRRIQIKDMFLGRTSNRRPSTKQLLLFYYNFCQYNATCAKRAPGNRNIPAFVLQQESPFFLRSSAPSRPAKNKYFVIPSAAEPKSCLLTLQLRTLSRAVSVNNRCLIVNQGGTPGIAISSARMRNTKTSHELQIVSWG